MLHDFRRPCLVAFRVHTSCAHHRSHFLLPLSASRLTPLAGPAGCGGERLLDREIERDGLTTLLKRKSKSSRSTVRKKGTGGTTNGRKEKDFFFYEGNANLLSPVYVRAGETASKTSVVAQRVVV